MIGILNHNCGALAGRIVNVGSFKDGKYLISAPNEGGKDGFVGEVEENSILVLLPSAKKPE